MSHLCITEHAHEGVELVIESFLWCMIGWPVCKVMEDDKVIGSYLASFAKLSPVRHFSQTISHVPGACA
jgi:hypothetical protein